MALAKVQGTGKTVAINAAGLSISFASPPTVGNGIIVLITSRRGAGTPTFPAGGITDNQGNTYTLATSRFIASGGAGIYYCPKITGTGTPFTITFASGSGTTAFAISAIEISGVTVGLNVHRIAGSTGSGLTPSTGSTASILANEVLVVGVIGCTSTISSSVIGVVSPIFTEEHEHLDSTTGGVGEGNSRIVTSAAGTFQSASWTIGTSVSWATVLVVFVDSATASVLDLSQLPLETVVQSTTPIDLSLSQLPLEIVTDTGPPVARITQYVVETLLSNFVSLDLRVTQDVIEILTANPTVVTSAESVQFYIVMP